MRARRQQRSAADVSADGGHIASIVDSAGRKTTYGYDASDTYLLTVTSAQLWQIIAVAAIAVGIMLVTGRTQLFRAFDPAGFEAVGFHPLRTDLALAAATSAFASDQIAGGSTALAIAKPVVPREA